MISTKKIFSAILALCLLMQVDFSFSLRATAENNDVSGYTVTKEINVAQNKPVYASQGAVNPEYANDGLLSTRYTTKSIVGSEKQYWMVDLGREFVINSIKIHDSGESWEQHRTDICVEGSSTIGFENAVTLDSITTNEDPEKYPKGGVWTITPGKTPYRYIRIRKLNLQSWCPYIKEVEIFADVTMTELEVKNTSAKSSAHEMYSPEKAVDNNQDTSWISYDKFTWWSAEFVEPHSVDYIEFWYNKNQNSETRRSIDILGSDEQVSDATDFSSLQKLESIDASTFIEYPHETSVYSPKSYKYAVYYKTLEASAIGSLSEFNAYMISPDIYDVNLDNNYLTVRFSDDMDETTLTEDNIMITDAQTGENIPLSDISYDNLVFSAKAQLETAKAYKITVNTGVKTKKNTPLAKKVEKTIINGTLPEYGEDVYEKTVYTNVAQNKPFYTSDTDTDASNAAYVIDGIANDKFWIPKSKRSDTTETYYTIDLTREYKVDKIEVYDGGNSDSRHRTNLSVMGSHDNANWVTLDSIGNSEDSEKYPQNGRWDIYLNGEHYRYIKVASGYNTTWLPYLREIKVFAEQTVTEVSRNRPATACGSYSETFAPSKANDGINLTSTNSTWVRNWGEASGHKCWWRVDLGSSYNIDYLEIEDRTNIENQKAFFEVVGTNSVSTADETFPEGVYLAGRPVTGVGASGTLHKLETTSFPKGGMWQSSAKVGGAYRYIVWKSLLTGQSSGLAEFRAFTVNPEIYELNIGEGSAEVVFSDDMLEETLTPDTVKLFDENGNELRYTEYMANGNTYTINSSDVHSGQRYSVKAESGARNKKLVPVANLNNTKTAFAADDIAIEYFDTVSYVDSNGATLGKLFSGGSFEAKAEVKNNTNEVKNVAVMTALYKNNELIGTNIKSVQLAGGERNRINTVYDLPEKITDEYTAKAFLWDMNEMKPLDNSITDKKQNLFNTDIIDVVPEYEETSVSAVNGLKSIYYKGLPYEGNETKVYAYYGIPEHAEGEKVPGVVLVHGGGGVAYASWVKAWNERGYAAIAMDLGGKNPNGQRHEWAGPSQCTYSDLYKPIEDVWMYHAVSDVILANNILRSFDDVDTSKIGISGVSWGGVVTSTTIGVDKRFAFAIPIYGCGHLYESETYFKDTLAAKSRYIDPSAYFINSTLPVLFVNDDTDYHFSTTITTMSYEDIADHAAISFLPKTPHSQETAEAMKEPYEFADGIVKNGIGLIRITDAESDGTTLSAQIDIPEGRSVSSVYLSYNTDDKFKYNSTSCTSTWETQDGILEENSVIFTVPDDAVHYYISVVDNDGNIVSTKQFMK